MMANLELDAERVFESITAIRKRLDVGYELPVSVLQTYVKQLCAATSELAAIVLLAVKR